MRTFRIGNKMLRPKYLFFILLLTANYCSLRADGAGEEKSGRKFNKDYRSIGQIVATIDTWEGKIQVDLNFHKAPNTVANFVSLAQAGFYNGLTFHRVIPGFVVQGGDPAGDGSGGPGYSIDDEENDLTHEANVISMAKSGPNTGGSQFYLTQMPQAHLNGQHTVFGQVVSGFDVVTRIEQGDPIKSIKIEEIRKP